MSRPVHDNVTIVTKYFCSCRNSANHPLRNTHTFCYFFQIHRAKGDLPFQGIACYSAKVAQLVSKRFKSEPPADEVRSFDNERESFSRKVALDCRSEGKGERERERERLESRGRNQIWHGAAARRFVRGNPNERAGEHLQSGSNFIVSAKSSPLTLNNLRRRPIV